MNNRTTIKYTNLTSATVIVMQSDRQRFTVPPQSCIAAQPGTALLKIKYPYTGFRKM